MTIEAVDFIKPRDLQVITDTLQSGGVIIIPTDTVYTFACDAFDKGAIEKICLIKGLKPEKANFSFLFSDISEVAEYTLPISNQTFRTMKQTLPGAYTYLLNANNVLPKILKNNKKTLGVRIPDHPITQAIIKAYSGVIAVSSVKIEDDVNPYLTIPYEIEEKFGNQVSIIIDSGTSINEHSTIVDCTSGICEVIRVGAAPF